MPFVLILVDLPDQLLLIGFLNHMTLVLVTCLLDDRTGHVILALFGLLLSPLLCQVNLFLKIFPQPIAALFL
jgi:hypothetical protein